MRQKRGELTNPLLSVVIPVFNERETIGEIVARVLAVPLRIELVVVDLTLVTNLLYDTMLSDMETCYKVMRAEVLRGLVLRSRRFEIEPELAAKIFKRGYRVCEMPITYNGRSYHEGKKIT
jgi:hypothetical protein